MQAVTFNRSLLDLNSVKIMSLLHLSRMEKCGRINREAGGGLCAMTVGTVRIWVLFGVSLAVSPGIECESTSLCVIAGCLFPFVYTSIFLWVTARLCSGYSVYRAHINECLQTEAHMQTLWDEYLSTHWTGHLAWATERLMQNTTRLGRWQLHQEVGPQQAKGPCAHRSCPDTRWSGGHWRLVGWQPRKGGGAGGGRKEGSKEFEFDSSLGLTLWNIYLFSFSFVGFLSAVIVDIVVSQISIVVQKMPHRTVNECTEPSGVPGCLFSQELKRIPQCQFREVCLVCFSLFFHSLSGVKSCLWKIQSCSHIHCTSYIRDVQ